MGVRCIGIYIFMPLNLVVLVLFFFFCFLNQIPRVVVVHVANSKAIPVFIGMLVPAVSDRES